MASPTWKKLNLKDETTVVVLNALESFDAEIASLEEVNVTRALPSGPGPLFLLAFVTTLAEIERVAERLPAVAEGDCTIWFSYPKGSSKRYTCEFSRDTGWASLGAAGFEAVRQVAIDEDWSALRFRRAEYIKSMKRDPKRAISKVGKARTRNRSD